MKIKKFQNNDFYNLSAHKTIFHFLNSKGTSLIFIGFLILIRLFQFISFMIDPGLRIFENSQANIKFSIFLQFVVVCLTSIQVTIPSTILFPFSSFFHPGIVIFFSLIIIFVDKYFKNRKQSILEKDNWLIIITMNLALVVCLIAPFPLFEEFFHILLCSFPVTSSINAYPSCLSG